MACVYIATNLVNGKRYIGVSIHPLHVRVSQHFCVAKTNHSRNKKNIFYKAIRKYGRKNFSFSVLTECEPEKVFFEEIRLIALLKPEYNGTSGGEGNLGRKMSAYCKKRLAEGRKKNAKKIRKVLSALGKTKEFKERFDKYRHLGSAAVAKRVVCLDDGRTYASASAASRYYNVEKSSVIEVCNRNKVRKTAGGRVFRYFGDHCGGKKEARSVKAINKRLLGKKVLCVEDNKIFNSAAECGRYYDLCGSFVGQVCAGKYKTGGGKHFVFYIGTPLAEAA